MTLTSFAIFGMALGKDVSQRYVDSWSSCAMFPSTALGSEVEVEVEVEVEER